jgi:uncharacterized protein YggE
MKTAITLAVVMLACTAARAAPNDDILDGPHITVTGSGSVDAKPDMATITVGVVTEGETAAAALDQNTERMQKLFDNLKAGGIEEKDMQTANFNVSPKYSRRPPNEPRTGGNDGNERPIIIGYTVINEVRIKVRRLSSLGRVLDKSVQEGANRIHGISFSIDDETNLLDEARKKAMADARRKAELLAEAADVPLGPAIRISDQQGPRPLPAQRFRGAEAAQAVPVAPGEVTHRASVEVTYQLVGPAGSTAAR